MRSLSIAMLALHIGVLHVGGVGVLHVGGVDDVDATVCQYRCNSFSAGSASSLGEMLPASLVTSSPSSARIKPASWQLLVYQRVRSCMAVCTAQGTASRSIGGANLYCA